MISANRVPDHTTIARFRQRHEATLAELFGEVLWLCAGAGLVRVGVIAVDATKVHANASHHATRDYEQIAREILEYADAGGPAALATRRPPAPGRAPRVGARPIPGPRPKRLKEAKRRLEGEHQVHLDANAADDDYRRNRRMKNGRRLGAHSPPKRGLAGLRSARL